MVYFQKIEIVIMIIVQISNNSISNITLIWR